MSALHAFSRILRPHPKAARAYSSFFSTKAGGGGRYFTSAKIPKVVVTTKPAAPKAEPTSEGTTADSTQASAATGNATTVVKPADQPSKPSSSPTQSSSGSTPKDTTTHKETPHILPGSFGDAALLQRHTHPTITAKDFKLHQFFSLHRPLLLLSQPHAIMDSANAFSLPHKDVTEFEGFNSTPEWLLDEFSEATADADAAAARQLARAMTMNHAGAAVSWEQTLKRLGLDVEKDRVGLQEVMMDSTKRKRKKKMKKHKYVPIQDLHHIEFAHCTFDLPLQVPHLRAQNVTFTFDPCSDDPAFQWWHQVLDPSCLEGLKVRGEAFSWKFFPSIDALPTFSRMKRLHFETCNAGTYCQLNTLLHKVPNLVDLRFYFTFYRGNESPIAGLAHHPRTCIQQFYGSYDLLHLVANRNLKALSLRHLPSAGCPPDKLREKIVAEQSNLENLTFFNADIQYLDLELLRAIRTCFPRLKTLHLRVKDHNDEMISVKTISCDALPDRLEHVYLQLHGKSDVSSCFERLVHHPMLHSICITERERSFHFGKRSDPSQMWEQLAEELPEPSSSSVWSLPNEVLGIVLGFVPFAAFKEATLTCKAFRHLGLPRLFKTFRFSPFSVCLYLSEHDGNDSWYHLCPLDDAYAKYVLESLHTFASPSISPHVRRCEIGYLDMNYESPPPTFPVDVDPRIDSALDEFFHLLPRFSNIRSLLFNRVPFTTSRFCQLSTITSLRKIYLDTCPFNLPAQLPPIRARDLSFAFLSAPKHPSFRLWHQILDPTCVENLEILGEHSTWQFFPSIATLPTFSQLKSLHFRTLNAETRLQLPSLLQNAPILAELRISFPPTNHTSHDQPPPAIARATLYPRTHIRLYDGPYDILHLVANPDLKTLFLRHPSKGCPPDKLRETLVAEQPNLENLVVFKGDIQHLDLKLLQAIQTLFPHLETIHLQGHKDECAFSSYWHQRPSVACLAVHPQACLALHSPAPPQRIHQYKGAYEHLDVVANLGLDLNALTLDSLHHIPILGCPTDKLAEKLVAERHSLKYVVLFKADIQRFDADLLKTIRTVFPGLKALYLRVKHLNDVSNSLTPVTCDVLPDNLEHVYLDTLRKGDSSSCLERLMNHPTLRSICITEYERRVYLGKRCEPSQSWEQSVQVVSGELSIITGLVKSFHPTDPLYL
ncbi:hypothetical protein H0H93_013837 [Arthromyces matolae]|nr:hypothetical protein H0H93_013837 [Arthromyces matolae]